MMGNSVAMRLLSFRLNSMGAFCEYEFSEDEIPEALGLYGLRLVMKDGSEKELLPDSAGLYDETNKVNASFRLTAPVELSDAEHMLLPDGTKLHLPE